MKKLRIYIVLAVLFGVSVFLKNTLYPLLESENVNLRFAAIFISLGLGTYIIFKIAKYIEDITAILKEKTGIAGGLLQAAGTAFPDAIIGIIAAIMSLKVAGSNYALSVSYAIIAASATFGSNIYNIGHAAWCMWRQNLANKYHKNYKMFPLIGGGMVKPMHRHPSTPYLIEMNTALRVLAALTILTVLIALGMVMFGQVKTPDGLSGDFYQLKREIGIIIALAVLFTLFLFRKNYGSEQEDKINPFRKVNQATIWISLIICGVTILFTAETMVEAIASFSRLTHVPVVISGMAAGLIGCLAEMTVIHNFTVNPKGRIGDAIVGVAMDNIITIFGASIIAIMGGMFLGGSSLIRIFVLVLAVNSILMWQVAELKDEYVEHRGIKHN